MAEVKLQVIVKREQVDALQKDIDKLNNTTINVKTREFSDAMGEAAKSTERVASNVQKIVRTYDADGNLTKRVQDMRTGLHEVTRETEKLNEDTGELELTQTKVTQTFKQATKQTSEAAKATEQHGKATKEAAKQESFMEKILGRTTGEFIARMTVYRAVYAGIRAVTNGFQEAIQTLRAVDDELVAVRKVTGFDQYQMEGVESRTYEVASKYGANAAEYVQGVASFARAGYKELSGDLAELAQKTIIVGDTTGEIANQFFLSVDAAYKFNGSVRELSKVLDAANELDNKYATSISAIAEGMGIVAPVAAQMHVGVYELEAAIGTITAVTQRSGTEAARALRAIMLNIVGDTKTEIEEGVTWTTGEIAGLKDVIKEFAPEVYKAAQATGSIIDPMKAIGGLAESFEKGLLTEQKLMEMVSDIGGKLRTSQLLALIQNWDMYNKMLTDTANAVGSADKEIANAMDSWTRKTNVLKNTWTEFIKSGLNSGQIKFLLDALTWIIQHLGTLTGAVERLALVLAALKLHSTAKELTQISKGLLDVEKDASKAAQMMSKFGVSAKALNVASGIIGGLTLAWTAYTAIQAEIERKHQERVQAIYNEAEAAKESAGNILDLYVEMDKAADSASDFTSQAKTLADTLGIDLAEGADKARQKIAELSAEELRRKADKANTAYITAQDEYLRSHGKGAVIGPMWNLYNARNVQYLLEDIPSNLRERIQGVYSSLPISTAERTAGAKTFALSILPNMEIDKALKFRDAMQEIIDIRDEYIRQGGDQAVLDSKYFTSIEEYLGETSEAFSALEKARKDAIDTQAMELFQKAVTSSTVQSKEDLDELISGFDGMRDVSDEVKARLIELANEYYDFSSTVQTSSDALNRETTELYANQKALDANATAADKAAAAKKDAEAATAAHIDALFDETGALTNAGRAAFAASQYLADLANSELNARMEAAKANYATLRAELAGVSAQALKAAYALLAMEAAVGNGDGIVVNEYNRIAGVGGGAAGRAAQILRQLKALEAEMNSITAASQAVAPYASSSSYSSGGGSSHSSGGHSGGSGRTSGSSGGGKSSSSSASTEDKKLTALQNRVNLLKSELSLMQERGDSEEAQAAKMREIMAALKNEADYLKSIKGDQITINNLTQEWWSYNNKLAELMDKEASAAQDQAEALQKALEAQRALNNALKDRSVRYYNAQTGQWEWTANAENVASATKARDEAISAAGYDNLDAWNTYYKIASTMESIRAFTDFVNAHPSVSIWDIPELMRNSYTSNYGGTTNSNIYNFGGFTMSEQQAKGTTLYEMARRSRGLALHSSTY